jgi:membrane-associated PAP2 superfamily phosphatase
MLILTPFTSAIDLDVARACYSTQDPTGAIQKGFTSNSFFSFMFKYGCLPAHFTFGIATISFVLSFYMPKFRPYRSATLMISLCMIIGAGLIAHTLLKEFWGRPRPRQVIEFGGKQEFRPYYVPSLKKPPEPSKSFPSGHSTCGFYFFCLYFVGKRYHSRLLTNVGLVVSLGLGILLSMARVIQGGHFMSDVIFSAFLMWETAYFMDWLVFDCKAVRQKLKL